ncbi:MAG: HAMP domain-containing sensor histidine kinase [Pseudomonadales bacterium]
METLVFETDQLLATFNALLRIARIESGNTPSTLAPLQLATLVQDVVELYEPLAADKNISIGVTLEDGATIVGDRNLVFQAIANLLDNAIKFTPANGCIGVKLNSGSPCGGSHVLESKPERERDDPLTNNENESQSNRSHATLKITDTGPGVSPGNYKKMFQRFYREEQSRGQKPGNGLGLSMVYATMKLHNGAILVEDNKPGLVIKLVFNCMEN